MKLTTGAKVKNVWHYTSTPQCVFMAWCLVKRRNNFTFIFNLPHFYLLVLSPETFIHFETYSYN